MARTDLTLTDHIETLRLLEEYGTTVAAAKAIGVPRSTMQSRVREAKAAKEQGLLDEKRTETELASAKAEIRLLRKRVKAAETEGDTAEKIRRQIYNLSEVSPKPPAWVIKKTKAGLPGVPMTLWSDWHWGEVVNAEEVGGVNEFNSEIAKKRVVKLVDTVIDLAVNHMVNPNYPGIVVCLGGDMISGDIHEELQDTNDDYLLSSLMDIQDVLAASLLRLADVFGRVFVPCVVGNHGRSTKKPRMKGRVYTSFEWNLYCQLERFFRDDPRIQFFIPNETDAHFTVLGHRFCLTHGDSLGVKGGDGIIGALGPIMRGAIKVGRSEAQIGREFDTILMGHWHQYIALPGLIVNGTLKGFDEFARLALRAKYERPTQALWFVNQKHGITAQWPIYLEPSRRASDSSEWVTWATPK